MLFSGLARAPGPGLLAGCAFVLVYAIVGAQSAWLLRPFVVRPRTEHVPFVRAIEGDLLDAVRTSARSASGDYEGADERRRTFERRMAPRERHETPAESRTTNCESPPCD